MRSGHNYFPNKGIPWEARPHGFGILSRIHVFQTCVCVCVSGPLSNAVAERRVCRCAQASTWGSATQWATELQHLPKHSASGPRSSKQIPNRWASNHWASTHGPQNIGALTIGPRNIGPRHIGPRSLNIYRNIGPRNIGVRSSNIYRNIGPTELQHLPTHGASLLGGQARQHVLVARAGRNIYQNIGPTELQHLPKHDATATRPRRWKEIWIAASCDRTGTEVQPQVRMARLSPG